MKRRTSRLSRKTFITPRGAMDTGLLFFAEEQKVGSLTTKH